MTTPWGAGVALDVASTFGAGPVINARGDSQRGAIRSSAAHARNDTQNGVRKYAQFLEFKGKNTYSSI